MKKTGRQLDAEITEALRTRRAHTQKRKPKSLLEIRTARLETLKAIMQDVLGDPAWGDTDPEEIEKWISVDDGLSDREWLDTAKNQLVDENVLPEHAGAPPSSVYKWNDVFIDAYRMNIDQGMGREAAVNSARKTAFDIVTVAPNKQHLLKTDPVLYGED